MPLTLEPTAEDKAYEQAATGKSESAPAPKAEAKAAPEPKEATIERDTGGRDDKGRYSSAKAKEEVGGEDVETESKPEPKAAEKPKELPRVAAPKQVPVGAMLEERRRAQQAERELEELKAWRTQTEKELHAIRNPPKAAPDPSLDPDGYNRWKIDQLEGKVNAYENETKAQKTQREQRETVQRRIEDADQYERASMEEFAKARPDQFSEYQNAINFYKTTMRELLPSMGVRRDQVDFTIDGLVLQTIEDAKTSGENAAERFWNLSSRLGFQPAAKKTGTATEPMEDQAVDTSQSDDTLRAVSASLDKMTTIAEGMKASKSIAASGGKGGGRLTLGEILSSSEGASLLEETELDKLPRSQARKLMGG